MRTERLVAVCVLLVLLTSACATPRPAPEPRTPVAVPAGIALPAPPRARLCPGELEPRICYSLDDAWALGETLDAAFALHAQAQALLETAQSLDAEAAALDQALRAREREVERLHAAQHRERWAWRLGVMAAGLLWLGVTP